MSYLIQQFDDCRFLSLGAGGGGELAVELPEPLEHPPTASAAATAMSH